MTGGDTIRFGAVSSAQAQATLTIDLGALTENWRALAARAAPAECAAVVKADAYGIGIDAAVPALHKAGCRTFFVAHVSEGVRARSALDNADARIFVLNGLLPASDTIAIYRARRLQPVLGSARDLDAWRSACAEAPCPPAALHVDTGMNRLGLSRAFFERASGEPGWPGFPLDLVMSHFVSSETADAPINARQIDAFAQVRAALPHVAASLSNSSGLFLRARPFYDVVRPGYALYGGNPTPGLFNPMRPVVSLTAPVLALHAIKAGDTVGYNAGWTARRDSTIATIGVGYADGIPRNATSTDSQAGGEAIVAGVRCPFAGRVSMDLITIDVTDVPRSALREPVEILGATLTVDDFGARSGTIGYEILTNLGRRYHRRYIGG